MRVWHVRKQYDEIFLRSRESEKERGMDYSLAALKILCAQLKDAREVASQNRFTLSAWLQGVLVSTSDGDLLLDDGTGVINLSLSGEFRNHLWRVGMYVTVVGGYIVRTGEAPMIKVHKIVDLSLFPDREAYNMFYQPPI